MINRVPVNQGSKPKKWPQRLALVMAIFAFILFGGGWLLNQNVSDDIDNGRKSLSPINGQKIWITGQESFRIEWTGPVDEESVLEVARDHEFRDIVLEEIVPKSPFITDKIPGEGDYYYRLLKKSNGEAYELLEPVRFTVISKSAPQMIYPFGAMTSEEGKAMRFYWQAKHGVSKYRFQLAFDKEFKNLLSDFVVNETQSIPQNLPVGGFYWRVRGEDNATAFTQWADTRRLTIEKPGSNKNVVAFNPPPPAPAASSTPEIKVEIKKELPAPKERSYASDPQPLTKLPKAMEKKVIAQKEKPKEKIKEKVKEKPKAKAKAEPKVKPAIVAKSPAPVVVKPAASESRKPASVPKNTLAMPRPKLPPDGVSIVSLNGTQDPILFKWEAIEGAERYRLEIATDKEFKDFIHSTVIRENQVVVTTLLPKGQIYWRIRAEQGENKSDWSPAFSIEK